MFRQAIPRWCSYVLFVAIIAIVGCNQVQHQIVSVVESDEYVINSAEVTGDTLSVSVSFSGGCEDHEFALMMGEGFLESDPVQLSIWITHDANGDTCEAYPTETHDFSLAPIKERYRQAYHRDEGVVILLLKDAPEGQRSLVYEWGE